MGEEDEEFAVVDHSLTSDGIIEEYYVHYKGQLVAVPAEEAIIIEDKPPHSSDEEHGVKKKKKNAKKLSKSEDQEKKLDTDGDGIPDGVPDWTDKDSK